jgi:aminoglycoside 3-N-acetyltransferase
MCLSCTKTSTGLSSSRGDSHQMTESVSEIQYGGHGLSPWKDRLLLIAERVAKQVQWDFPRLRAWLRRRRARRRNEPQVAQRRGFKEHLRRIGVREGALVLTHTSVTGMELLDNSMDAQRPGRFPGVAKHLLDDLLELVGPSGTLLMPTNSVYQTENDFANQFDKSYVFCYDPTRTPAATGLVNELFRRLPGVQRSLHPYNPVAARGPLAEELLRGNLNDQKPLPHGVQSSYYRFSQRNGLVVSIGTPLGPSLTLVHVAEEVRDAEWPIPDFFEERRCVVRVAGQDREYIIRATRPEYPMYTLCLRKFARDLVRAGILHEGCVGGVRVDWARAGEVVEFMLARGGKSTYPYYWTRPIRGKHWTPAGLVKEARKERETP